MDTDMQIKDREATDNKLIDLSFVHSPSPPEKILSNILAHRSLSGASSAASSFISHIIISSTVIMTASLS